MPNEFNFRTATEVLQQVVRELLAIGGGVWLEDRGELVAIATENLDGLGVIDFESVPQFLEELLDEALETGRPLVQETSGLSDVPAERRVTLLVSPFRVEQVRGAILIAQRPGLPQQQRDGQLSYLTKSGINLGRQLRTPQQKETVVSSAVQSVATAHPTSRTVDARTVLDFVLSLQRSLDLNEVAGVAVNDGRLLFGADRVSLVLRRGGKGVVTAVSGQESVHPRGNLIRSMRTLATQVMLTGEPFRYDGNIQELPPQLERPLAEFVQEGGARFLLMVPLLEPERLVKPEEPSGNARPLRHTRRTIGVLVVEQMTNSEPSSQLSGTLDAVIDHIAAALFNAKTHSSIFLLPVWRGIGRFSEWLRGRRRVLAVVIVALLMAFGVSLVVVPWPYRVDATGRLMPGIQREVFAPWDGQVVELLVQGGEHVTEGQALLSLRNDELSAELVAVENELREKRKLSASLAAQRDDASRQGNRDEELKLQGKAVEARVETEGAALKSSVLKDRLERLTIRAPIAGVVTTFQVQQLLLNRPVKRGDVLLQVMDETGDWQLELEVAEHRVGRILVAQQKRVGLPEPADQQAAPEKKSGEMPRRTAFHELPIEYRLLTQPEVSYLAVLSSLSTRAVTAETQGSVVEARAALDKSDLPARSIGAEVRARIGCGTSSLGDVLFGDVIEFVQKYLWW